MVKIMIRGDSYLALRPPFVYYFVDDNLEPWSLVQPGGCIVQTTYKRSIEPMETDWDDVTASVKHELHIDEAGYTTMSNGLVLPMPAEEGIIEEHFTSDETKLMPLDDMLHGDIQITIPTTGDVLTWIYMDAINTIEGVTHRPPEP